MCQCEWNRPFKKKKKKTCLTFMIKLNGFYYCTFSIAFTTIMTFSSWSLMEWLLLVCQASSPSSLPTAMSGSLQVLKYFMLSNTSVSFHVWSFCLECLSQPAQRIPTFMIFQFYLKCFCDAFPIFPRKSWVLLCPYCVWIVYLCIEAVVYCTDLHTCLLLDCKLLEGRDWIFVCSQLTWFSIHPHSSVLIYPLSLPSLYVYFRWFKNVAGNWSVVIKTCY